jgi:hypothetical protein
MMNINKVTEEKIQTCESLDVNLGITTSTTQFSQDHLLLSDRRCPSRGFPTFRYIGATMHARCNHTEKEIRPVILNGPTQNLLVDRYGGGALDATQCMNGCSDTQIANALGDDICGIIRRTTSFLAIFNRNFSKPNTDSANIAA